MKKSIVIHNDREIEVPPTLRIFTKLALWAEDNERRIYWWNVISSRRPEEITCDYLIEFGEYISIETINVDRFTQDEKTTLIMHGLL